MTSHLQSVDFVCGNCQTQISPGSRFCLGCGQPLYEACSCGAEVLLNQAFCNHCGCDLQQKLNHRRDEIEKRLCLAEASRGEGDWSGAVKLLQGARVPQDFRFHDLRQRIDEAIDAIEREAKTWEGRIHKALETAESLAGEQRHRQLIELVEAIPPRARPSRLQDWLAAAQRHVAAEESARSRLQESLDRSDYADALAAAVALLELKPQSSSRRRQVEKLMAIVRQRAKQYARAGRHDKCLELLRCMPAEMQHHEDQELLRDCDETVLAGAVVRHAAQVTPLVVKLLDRCFTDAPSNPLRTKLSQAIARAQRRHRETKAPFVYPLRRAVRLAETNVPIYPLNIPAGVAIDGNVAARLGPTILPCPGRSAANGRCDPTGGRVGAPSTSSHSRRLSSEASSCRMGHRGGRALGQCRAPFTDQW
ncbi:MAG: hypothetical protein KatS3mg111_1153 [Pirellulaceae bacterium]|nr:MAG: hypothetical protein KatS3mg111_1153 [Pirellulaceae bacterium]